MLPIKTELPEYFLDEEVRCGYTVTEKMKKVWAVELDLLSAFINICDKYNLTYFAYGGTLLGAVRHNGYIPWDDDIDIVMPRKDYDKFMEIAPNELQYPYFMSTPMTEYKFWRTHIQIRNSDTTAAGESEKSLNNNKGIFIDIFPLDSVPESLELREKHRKKLKRIAWLFDIDNASKAPSKKKWKAVIKRIIDKVLFKVSDNSYKKAFLEFNYVQSMFEKCQTKYLAHTSLIYREKGGLEKRTFDKEDFSQKLYVNFENIKIAIPVKYDDILRKVYGEDYMKIPQKIISSSHGKLFYDTDNGYKKYFTQEVKK